MLNMVTVTLVMSRRVIELDSFSETCTAGDSLREVFDLAFSTKDGDDICVCSRVGSYTGAWRYSTLNGKYLENKQASN